MTLTVDNGTAVRKIEMIFLFIFPRIIYIRVYYICIDCIVILPFCITHAGSDYSSLVVGPDSIGGTRIESAAVSSNLITGRVTVAHAGTLHYLIRTRRPLHPFMRPANFLFAVETWKSVDRYARPIISRRSETMRDDPLVTERGTAELNPKMLVSRQGREFDRARLTFLATNNFRSLYVVKTCVSLAKGFERAAVYTWNFRGLYKTLLAKRVDASCRGV